MDDKNKNDITYFAETDARNKKIKFGIRAEDRLRHFYSIGKTGMGKSTLLENMAIQDIQNGEGMAFLDPHGKTADLLLDYIPEHRIKDLIYFAPFDIENPISFNVMEDVGADRRHLVVSGLMSAFEKIWVDAWSARMAYILQNTLAALLEYPGATMLGINRMLSDKIYRQKVVDNVKDSTTRSFWVDEFAKYTERFAAEATPAIQNKVGQFTSNPLIRNIIGQARSSFDIRKIMDEKKILIVNLSKGLVGENNANLLGSMIVTKIYLAAMSRADASPAELKRLPNFYLYVDEFQSFANKSFADILSEARKYKLSLNITHQYIEQMAEEVRAAVFGNVGTMVTFRVGSYDAELLEKEFAPVFTMEDIVNLGFAQIYLRLMINGVASQPFSATTLAPISKPEKVFREEALKYSRQTYSHNKTEVEQSIKDWYLPDTKNIDTTKGDANNKSAKEVPKRDFKDAPRGLNPDAYKHVVDSFKGKDIVKNDAKVEDKPISESIDKIENPVVKKEPTIRDQININIDKQKVFTNPQNVPNKPPISLSVLNEDKNKNKNAKPESVNALRDALLKIQSKDGAVSPENKKETTSNNVAIQDLKDKISQSKIETPKIEYKPVEPVQIKEIDIQNKNSFEDKKSPEKSESPKIDLPKIEVLKKPDIVSTPLDKEKNKVVQQEPVQIIRPSIPVEKISIDTQTKVPENPPKKDESFNSNTFIKTKEIPEDLLRKVLNGEN